MGNGEKGLIDMSTFIIALLISSVTMSVLALIYMALSPKLARRYSTKWIYYAWLIIVIGLIIPIRPALENAVIQIEVPQNIRTNIQTQAEVQHAPPPNNNELTTSDENRNNTEQFQNNGSFDAGTGVVTSEESANISWAMILTVIWLLGAVLVLVCHVIRHKRFIRSVWRWGEDVKDRRTLDVWQAVLKEMNITAEIVLQRSELTGSPLLTGIFYPRIMLPKVDITDDEIALILKHELVHYKRKDLWYKGLVVLAVAIHWFNPMIYVIAKTISFQCERSCDDEVIKHKGTDSRFEYSTAIIHSIRYAESTTALSTNFFGGKKEMKNRISSIMDMSRKRRGTLIICAVLTLTLVTGLAFSVITDEPEEFGDTYDGSGVTEVPDELGYIDGESVIVDVPEDVVIGMPDESEVISQMAGNWRSQAFSTFTANDIIVSLLADGSWEESGPLATDNVIGGNFYISRVEEDIYDLTFILEHSTCAFDAEFLGYDLGVVLQYDLRNDRLSRQSYWENELRTIWYIRVPHAARDAAPTWDEDALTRYVTDTPDGRLYQFDALGFAFTLPNSWDGYYSLEGGDEGWIHVRFDAMGVYAELFSIFEYDSEMIFMLELEVIHTFDVGNARYIMYHRGLRSLVLGNEDFSSLRWELSDEMNQQIRETLARMYQETDTVVADSIRVLLDTP